MKDSIFPAWYRLRTCAAELFAPPLSSSSSSTSPSPLIVRGSSRTDCPRDNDTTFYTKPASAYSYLLDFVRVFSVSLPKRESPAASPTEVGCTNGDNNAIEDAQFYSLTRKYVTLKTSDQKVLKK